MAQAVEDLLGDKIDSGLIIVKDGYALPTRKIQIAEGGHPIPDSRGVQASTAIIRLVEDATSEDLILCLFSGGASALLSAPAQSISLQDKQWATELLLNCGAKIQEINAIRKHASKLKGGRLAQLADPAQVVSLILSDVIGDPIDSIASGPTAPDPTTFADCLAIIERYDLSAKMPLALIRLLEAGRNGMLDETPKPGDSMFAKVQNVVVGNNRTALSAAKEKAKALGYRTLLLSRSVEGENAQAALFHTAIAKEIRDTGLPVSGPACVVSGGETTVNVRGGGLGGRNQEFVTSAAIEIANLQGVVILSAGTDGTDGPTDAAGGIVDGTTVSRAQKQGLEAAEYLRRNDCYHFLSALGDLVVTGPTFTNVMDIHIVLVA
jgi:hydroxypyruvate reductase